MNIKICGDSTGHPNTGTSKGLINYMCHEQKELGINETVKDKNGQEIPKSEAIQQLDNNRRKLCNDDEKFFAIIVSPSKSELEKCGNYLDRFTASVMDEYAKNFKNERPLQGKDELMYFYTIHENRGDKKDNEKHIHIIVSRKDADNNRKISPEINGKDIKKGPVKGGFDRSNFYQNVEKRFDKEYNYERKMAESYEYCKAFKRADLEKLKELHQGEHKRQEQIKNQEQKQSQNQMQR